MATKKYILPIEATTLAHYYSRACIAPVSYMKKGHHDAIQSMCPNALLLTENHYGVKGSNCYLVLNLTEEEIMSERMCEIADDFYLYTGGLPISRVDEIVFSSEEQKSTTITNVEMGNAFVRGCVISSDKQFDQAEIPEINNEIEKNQQLAEKLQEYDRIMGALMFMRLANENASTYSENFLQTVALYSNYFTNQLKILGIDTTTKYEIFFEEKYKEFRDIVKDFVSEDVILEYARKHKMPIKIDPIRGYNFQTLKSDNILYTLALLQNFSLTDGEGGRDKIDDLILNGFYHKGFIISSRAESFAFYYGYNRGYNKFRNQYKLDKKCKEVKFRFDSVFEKYIAEEVFQTVVLDSVNNELSFLNNGQTYESQAIGKGEYKILDSTILIKKKTESKIEQNFGNGSATVSSPSTASLTNENLVDIRVAKRLILLNKTDRREIAKLAGCPKTQRKIDTLMLDFLLHLSYDKLEELYIETTLQKKEKKNNSKSTIEEQEAEENKEPKLFDANA